MAPVRRSARLATKPPSPLVEQQESRDAEENEVRDDTPEQSDYEEKEKKTGKVRKRRSQPMKDANKNESAASEPKHKQAKVVRVSTSRPSTATTSRVPPKEVSNEPIDWFTTGRPGQKPPASKSNKPKCKIWPSSAQMAQFKRESRTMARQDRLYDSMEPFIACIKRIRQLLPDKDHKRSARELLEFAWATASTKGNVTSAKAGNDSEGSEDEWEDVVDPGAELDDTDAHSQQSDETVQLTLPKNAKWKTEDEIVEECWGYYLRIDVNKRIKKRAEHTHKAHLLCWIAHARLLAEKWSEETKTRMVALWRSIVPKGYRDALCSKKRPNDEGERELMSKFVKWFHSFFRLAGSCVSAPSRDEILEWKSASAARLGQLIEQRVFENDRDLAELFFCCCRSLQLRVRITMHVRVVPRHPNSQTDYVTSGEYLATALGAGANVRTYCNEVWLAAQNQWHPVDASEGTTGDEAKRTFVGANVVLAVDQDGKVRDVAIRYATSDQRIGLVAADRAWWQATLNIWKPNEQDCKLEDVDMQKENADREMPTTMAAYKNHPLYALEKDLKKYEAIYPRDTQPLGEIRGHAIYPRSAVHHLQGELNWIKEALSIRVGEIPYKVVRARPKMNIPEDQRKPIPLNLFGKWQTEPYRPQEVVDGRIPRNEHNNVYMYQPEMVPAGCRHLKGMNGLMRIANRLEVDAVPALVGWEFSGAGNHPVIDGVVVLEEHAEAVIAAWKKAEIKRTADAHKKREKLGLDAWKRLVKCALRLDHVRRKFGGEASNQPSTSSSN